jgi:hypothetical protein
MHPHDHFSPTKRLDCAVEKGLQNLHACQTPLLQSPNGLQLGLQPVEVHLSDTVPLVGMGDGVATHEPEE